MRPTKWLAALVALLPTTIASAETPVAGFTPEDFDVGEPVLAYNLAVVPLYTRKAGPYDDYTILEEAQAAKAVAIREVDGNGQVSELKVSNKDARPMYLLGGEVVLGGKQDRMVSADTVVEPKSSSRVGVVCVEAGRWDGQNLAFQSGMAVAHPELRRKALFEGQGQVWNEVARKSAASNVSSSTGTYRRVLQDSAVRERIAKYLDEIQGQIQHNEKLAGVAVAINGELEVVDLFDSPILYRKLERKLLASYVLAALERQPGAEPVAEKARAKAKGLKRKDIDTFLKDSSSPDTSANAPTQATNDIGPLSTRIQRREPNVGTRGSEAGQGGGKVFFHKGKAVHGTFFGKKK